MPLITVPKLFHSLSISLVEQQIWLETWNFGLETKQ